jgi:hypothetical protein
VLEHASGIPNTQRINIPYTVGSASETDLSEPKVFPVYKSMPKLRGSSGCSQAIGVSHSLIDDPLDGRVDYSIKRNSRLGRMLIKKQLLYFIVQRPCFMEVNRHPIVISELQAIYQ